LLTHPIGQQKAIPQEAKENAKQKQNALVPIRYDERFPLFTFLLPLLIWIDRVIVIWKKSKSLELMELILSLAIHMTETPSGFQLL